MTGSDAGKAKEVAEANIKQKVNYGRLWVAVLEDSLSPTAKLCYATMGSFGSESKAKLSAIARRMGVKDLETVRKAQRELIASGWIQLVIEARNGKTRAWELMLPEERNLRVGLFPRVGISSPPVQPPPIKPLDNNQVNNKPIPQTTTFLEKEMALLHEEAFKVNTLLRQKVWTNYFWEKHVTAHEVKPHPPNFKWVWEKAYAITESMTHAEICRRVDNYFADPYLTSHPFENFVSKPDAWIEKRKSFEKGGTNARAFQQPASDWKPSGK